jgi:hypothetical protein
MKLESLTDSAAFFALHFDFASPPNSERLWFEGGKRILNYIESDRHFNALSFKDSLEEQGMIVDEDTLFPLFANM